MYTNIAETMYQYKYFKKLNEIKLDAHKGYYQKVSFNAMGVICLKKNNALE